MSGLSSFKGSYTGDFLGEYSRAHEVGYEEFRFFVHIPCLSHVGHPETLNPKT